MTVTLLLFTVYSVSPFKPLTLFACMETPGLHHNGKKKKVKNHTDIFHQTSKNNNKHLFSSLLNSWFYIQSYPHKLKKITLLPSLCHNQHFPCVVHAQFHTSRAPATASHAEVFCYVAKVRCYLDLPTSSVSSKVYGFGKLEQPSWENWKQSPGDSGCPPKWENGIAGIWTVKSPYIKWAPQPPG